MKLHKRPLVSRYYVIICFVSSWWLLVSHCHILVRIWAKRSCCCCTCCWWWWCFILPPLHSTNQENGLNYLYVRSMFDVCTVLFSSITIRELVTTCIRLTWLRIVLSRCSWKYIYKHTYDVQDLGPAVILHVLKDSAMPLFLELTRIKIIEMHSDCA